MNTSTGLGILTTLKGQGIPLLARILQVVDVYDALTTARPYKPALTHDHAAASPCMMKPEPVSGIQLWWTNSSQCCTCKSEWRSWIEGNRFPLHDTF